MTYIASVMEIYLHLRISRCDWQGHSVLWLDGFENRISLQVIKEKNVTAIFDNSECEEIKANAILVNLIGRDITRRVFRLLENGM